MIALAKERGADLIILDEERARKVARETGLPIIGTGGILLQAKKQGLLRGVKEALDLLIQHKIHLHKNLYKEILKEAGEEITV